jgi:hypothetical protein
VKKDSEKSKIIPISAASQLSTAVTENFANVVHKVFYFITRLLTQIIQDNGDIDNSKLVTINSSTLFNGNSGGHPLNVNQITC